MKKNYIKPEILTESMATEQMLATSVNLNDDPISGDQAEGKGDLDDWSDLWDL